MPVTLAEVAAACQVSVSTVSRALSSPEKVNPRTRARIERTARQLGYSASRAAQSLASGRTQTIGLMVPDISNPFFPPIVKAVQARARDKGYAVLLADTDEQVGDELELAQGLARQSDGVVLASPRAETDELAAFAAQTPTVFVNRSIPGAGAVVIDESGGAREAVDHLLSLGHRRICYLAGPRRSWSNQQRQEALAQACADAGAELQELGPFEPQIQAGMRAADLVQASGATAVIAYDDLIALGVMARLSEQGMQVGREISVVGIDDSPVSAVVHPMLTSIHVPAAELGTAAVNLLMNALRAPEGERVPSEVRLETRLVIRGSTGWAPTDPR